MAHPVLIGTTYYFQKRTPKDVRDQARGKTAFFEIKPGQSGTGFFGSARIGEFIKLSLRTSEPLEANARMAQVLVQLDQQFAAMRREEGSLTHKQILALAGEVYRLYVDRFSEEPGSPHDWAIFKAFNRAALEGRILGVPPLIAGFQNNDVALAQSLGSDLTTGINALPIGAEKAGMSVRFGDLADWVLAKNGLNVDRETRQRLLAAVGEATTKAGWTLKRYAQGDYSEDNTAKRFPAFEKSGPTFEHVMEAWKLERNPSASTRSGWKTATQSLIKFAGHDDMARISETDVVAWKNSLVTRKLKPKTINGGYLAAVNTLYRYAVQNHMLRINPAEAVGVLDRKRPEDRMRGYTDREVAQLIQLARSSDRNERKWLVLLAASTGARIGELAQLWKSSVEVQDGIPVLLIRPAPDGGTIKNANSERVVPIHPTLLELGFLDYVRSKAEGPLFYGKSSGAPERKHASKGVTNRLAKWIRSQGFTDTRKAPCHGFRHWWKTAALEAGMASNIADHIQGHAGKTEADTYREYRVELLRRSVEQIVLPVAKKST